jgi:ribosomal protein S18 acetylase RimI-like enzyme
MSKPMEPSRSIDGSGFNLRYPDTSDTSRLVEFAARVYYETFAAVNTPENMQAYLQGAFTTEQFSAEMADPAAVFLLAERGAHLCGYAKLLPGLPPECVTGENPIELVRLYVDRSWHGSGLASIMMEACLAEARQRGFKTMYLGVWEKNFRAQSFYRKWGFERVGEHIFQMGDDPQTDWWMTRPLKQATHLQ